MMRVKKKITVGKIIVYSFLALAVLTALFPFYFMIVSATASQGEILNIPPNLFFSDKLFHNWEVLNQKIDIIRVLFNSLFITITYTCLTLILHSMAGFALTKDEFKGKKFIFLLILMTMMIPAQVLYVPLFELMNNMGWANSYQAVILPGLANAFGIFLMRQNMMAFPISLIEAARIDGCGEFGIFTRITLPNMKPALGALAIYMFMTQWNSFMWPLIILSTKDMYTFPVALAVLDGMAWKKDYGVIMLGTTIAVLPIALMFLFMQKHFVAGIMGGAIKE